MEITPQLIEQIDFDEKLKGYNPDQVDDFLEQVGNAMAALLDRVDELTGHLALADDELAELRAARTAEPAPVVVVDQEEQLAKAARTLALAERTADAAISEARAEAKELLGDARARAEAELAEAAAESDRMLRDAKAQRDELLRRAREDADEERVLQRRRLDEEIESMGRRKASLMQDLQLLEDRMAEYRAGIERARDAMTALLDDPAVLREGEPLAVTPPPAPTSPFYFTGSNPVVSAGASIPLTGSTEAVVVVPEHVDASEIDLVDGAPDTGTADPWAPGSWNDVADASPEPAGESELPEAPEFVDVTAASSDDDFAPTEAVEAIDIADLSTTPDLTDPPVHLDGSGPVAGLDGLPPYYEDKSSGGRRFGRRR